MATQQVQWMALVQDASAKVKAARLLDADWEPGLLERVDAGLDLLLAGGAPGPGPTVRFVAPVPAGAIYGAQKWLAGSLGCDLFCKRGTPVVAPADCVVEEVIGGQGISGGAEIILSLADKSWAWRYRHVQASVRVGQSVKQGQAVGTVNDTSLDLLCAPPVRSYPSAWQHLDLSVSHGTDRFNPQGGGGGNYSASQWLAEIGYQGTQVARTPGPPSCGMGLADAVALMTPAGRR